MAFFVHFFFALFPPLVDASSTSDKAVELHSWLVGSQQKLLLGIGSASDGAAKGGAGGERADGSSSGYSRSQRHHHHHHQQQQQQLQRSGIDSNGTTTSSFKRRNGQSRSRCHRSRLVAVAADFSQRVSSEHRSANVLCLYRRSGWNGRTHVHQCDCVVRGYFDSWWQAMIVGSKVEVSITP